MHGVVHVFTCMRCAVLPLCDVLGHSKQREGESERFAKIGEPIGNKVLLWHGSRLTNYVGILSQGARC